MQLDMGGNLLRRGRDMKELMAGILGILLVIVMIPAVSIGGTLWINGIETTVGTTIVSPDIDGGTIDDTIIGGTTPAAGTFTDLSYTGTITPNCYDTIFIPAYSMTPTTTNGALYGETELATNDIMKCYYSFDSTTEEFVMVDIPIPESWNRGTVKAKFMWSSAAGSTAGDTVEWELCGQAIGDGDAMDTAFGDAGEVVSDILLANSGEDLQISESTPAITIGGTPALGDLIQIKISRNVSGTDDMTEDARLFGAIIQYKEENVVASW